MNWPQLPLGTKGVVLWYSLFTKIRAAQAFYFLWYLKNVTLICNNWLIYKVNMYHKTDTHDAMESKRFATRKSGWPVWLSCVQKCHSPVLQWSSHLGAETSHLAGLQHLCTKKSDFSIAKSLTIISVLVMALQICTDGKHIVMGLSCIATIWLGYHICIHKLSCFNKLHSVSCIQ